MPIVASTHISASDNFQLGDSADDKHVLHGHLSGSKETTGSFGILNVASGANISGPIYVIDNKKIFIGSGNDFELYHNGSHTYLHNTTGNIYYRNDSDGASHVFMTKYDGGSLTSVFEVTDSGAVLNQGNLTVANDIIIDDGGSLKEAGGTAAFTFDASGNVTKIGQDSPSSGQFLKWDGSKAVWDAASGGGGGSVTQSFSDGTATLISGSIASTGSFGLIKGDGSGITNIPAGQTISTAGSGMYMNESIQRSITAGNNLTFLETSGSTLPAGRYKAEFGVFFLANYTTADPASWFGIQGSKDGGGWMNLIGGNAHDFRDGASQQTGGGRVTYPMYFDLTAGLWKFRMYISVEAGQSTLAWGYTGDARFRSELQVFPIDLYGGSALTQSFSDGTAALISGSSTSTGSFGHILKGGVNWDTAVSASAQAAGFGSGGGGSGAISALNNATVNELVTVGATTTELDAEANLVFDGTKLGINTTSPTSPLHVNKGNIDAASVSSFINLSGFTYSKNFNVQSEGNLQNFRDVYFSPDGKRMFGLSSSWDLNSYYLSGSWDIGSAVMYNSVLPFGSNAGSPYEYPNGFTFSSDGMNMYSVGAQYDTIIWIKLTQPWVFDKGTRGYGTEYTAAGTFSIATQETDATGIDISPDGTNIYIVGESGDDVSQYKLSTPYDITTAAYLQNFSISSQEANVEGIRFKPSGDQFYIVGSSGDEVNVYNLTTNWDISTATAHHTIDVSGQDTNPNGLYVSHDGKNLYIAGDAGNTVDQWVTNLSGSLAPETYHAGVNRFYGTFQSVGDSSFDGKIDIKPNSEVLISSSSLKLDGGGAKLSSIYSNNISDMSASFVREISVGSSTPSNLQNNTGIFFSPDGRRMYLTDLSNEPEQWSLSTPWDISTGTRQGEVSNLDGTSYSTYIAFSDDGLTMFAFSSHNSSKIVEQLSLTKPWDILHTAPSNVKQYTLEGLPSDGADGGFWFGKGGTRMYVAVNDVGKNIVQYNMSGSWDIGTISGVSGRTLLFTSDGGSHGPADANPADIAFNGAGTVMYILGRSNMVSLYELGNAWEISSAQYIKDLPILAKDTNCKGLYVSPDQKNLYIAGNQNDKEYQYALTYDEISTAGTIRHDGDFHVSSDLTVAGHIETEFASGSQYSTGSFGHILKGGVNWDTAVSASAQAAGFGSGGGENATTITLTANNTENVTHYPTFADGVSGAQGLDTDNEFTYNPSTNTLTAGTFSGTSTLATLASTITLTANNTENVTHYPVFADGVSGAQGLDTDNEFTYNPSTNTLVAGYFSGDASLLTGNINAATITITANNSENVTHYPTFVDGVSGAQGLDTDNAFSYNPSTNTLTAGTFSGTSTLATLASTVTITANNSENVTHYPTFVDGVSGAQGLDTDNAFSYNPSTNTLTVSNFAGTATTATTATNVNVTANNSENVTHYPTFVDGVSGAQGLDTDNMFSYNPSTNTLTVPNLSGLASTATTATNVNVTANNSENVTHYPVFVDGVSGAQGLDTDNTFSYNPSTNTLVAGYFSGDGSNLTGISGGGGGGNLTTKGDIESYTTSQTRLAVGSNDYVLTADSTAAAGIAWKAAGGGVTISNNSNNRVVTGDGSNANAEANLTFDGSTLTVTGDTKVTGDITLDDGGSLKEAGGTAAFTFDASGNVTKIGQDVPSDQDLLMWNATSGLWEAGSAGSASSPFTSAGISGSWQSSNFLAGTVPLFTVTEQVTEEITLVGTNSDESGQTHSLPSGLLENDIVIVGYSTYHSAYGGSAPPSGWTLISNRNYWGANTTIVYYKKMGSTPDTTVTMGGPGADYMSVVSMAFRGVDTTTPLDASATDTQASSGMPNPPAITTVTSGSAIVAFGGIRYDQFVPTVPSGFDDIVYDYGGNANSTAMMACDFDSTRTPGAVDPGAFGGGYSDAWTATTIALRAMVNTVSFDWDDVDNSNVALRDLYPLNLSGSSAATASAIGSQGALLSVVNTAQNVDHGLGAYAGSTDYMSYKDDVSTSAGLLFRMGDFIGFPSFEAYTDQTFMMGHYHYPLLQRSGVMRISGSVSQQKLHRGKWNLGTTYSPTLSVFGSGSSVTDIVAESGPVFSTYENTSNPLRASERVLFQISNNTGISQLETYDDDSMRIGTHFDPFLTKDGNVRISGSALEQKIYPQHWNLGTLSPPVLSVYGSGSNVVNIKGLSGPHISSRDTLASSRANRTWSTHESYFSVTDTAGYQAFEIYEDKTLRYNLKHLKMSRKGHMILSSSAQEADKLNEPHWTLGSKSIPALSVYSSGSNITNTVGSTGPIFSTAEPNTGRIHRTYTSHTSGVPSIFSVSSGVGLPVVEAFEDSTIRLGTYSNPILDRNGIARISGSISSAKNYPGPWAMGTKDISTLTVIGSGSLFEVTSNRASMLSIEDRMGSYRTNTAYTSSTDALFSVTNVVGIDVFKVMADGTVDLSNYAKTGGIKNFAVSHPDLDNFEKDYISNESRGEIIYFGAGSVTQGKCYVLSGSNKTWIEGVTTEATITGNLLGVAKASGTASTVGMMIKGMVRVDSDLLNGTIEPGKPVYVSTTAGKYDFSPTTTSGDIVRTVGYCIDIADSDILLHFSPDNTSVTLS